MNRREWFGFWAFLIVTAVIVFSVLDLLAERIREEAAQPPLGELGPVQALKEGP